MKTHVPYKLRARTFAEIIADAFMSIAYRTGGLMTALPLELPDKAAVDKLPEGQRGLYVEKDGKFRLDVEGVEDTSGLKSALEKERTQRKEIEKRMKAELSKFEGIDPEKVRELMSHFDSSEDAELLKQGAAGIDKIVEKRVQKAQTEWQKKLDEAENRAKGAMEVAQTYMERVLDGAVTQIALKAGVHADAVEDVLLHARNMFSLNDEGEVVAFESDGETVIYGKDGKTPFAPGEWIEDMKEKKPHWFSAGNSGGGAGGGNKPTGKTIKRAAFEAMDPVERSTKMREGFKVVD